MSKLNVKAQLTKHVEKNKNKISTHVIGEEYKKHKGEFKLVQIGSQSYFSRICSKITVSSIKSNGCGSFITPDYLEFCIESIGQNDCWCSHMYQHVNEINISEGIVKYMINGEIKDKNILKRTIAGLFQNDTDVQLGIDADYYCGDNYGTEKMRIKLDTREYSTMQKDISLGGYTCYQRLSCCNKVKFRNPKSKVMEVTIKEDISSPIPNNYTKRNYSVLPGFIDEGDRIEQYLFFPVFLLARNKLELKIHKDYSILRLKVAITVKSAGSILPEEYILLEMKSPPPSQIKTTIPIPMLPIHPICPNDFSLHPNNSHPIISNVGYDTQPFHSHTQQTSANNNYYSDFDNYNSNAEICISVPPIPNYIDLNSSTNSYPYSTLTFNSNTTTSPITATNTSNSPPITNSNSNNNHTHPFFHSTQQAEASNHIYSDTYSYTPTHNTTALSPISLDNNYGLNEDNITTQCLSSPYPYAVTNNSIPNIIPPPQSPYPYSYSYSYPYVQTNTYGNDQLQNNKRKRSINEGEDLPKKRKRME